MNLTRSCRVLLLLSAAVACLVLSPSTARGDEKKSSSPKPAAPAKPAPAAKPAGGGGGNAAHPNSTGGAASHGPTTSNPSGHSGPTTSNPGGHATTTTGGGTHPTTTTSGHSTTANVPHSTTPGGSHTPAGVNRTATGRPAPTGSHTVTTKGGSAITRRPNGRISDVHDAHRNMDIHHNLAGGRRVSVERADHSRIVAERGRRGYIERRYEFHGHEFARRSYYWHGHEYPRYYRGYYYHGAYVNVYAPAYYYPPAYYGWAYNPWAAPVAYAGWGWAGNPWYGYYGFYFAPYPVYAGAAFWLTDYLIAAELQAAYAAGAAAAAGGAVQGGIQVVPNQLWTDSGVMIEQGQSYTVSATGVLQFNNNGALAPPAGRVGGPQVDAICAPGLLHNGFPAPQLPCLSLIAKIGPNGVPFEVGNSNTFVAASSGELFLGVNDQNLSDNSQGWVASVSPTGGEAAGLSSPLLVASLAPFAAPASGGGAPALSPEIKQMIADEVKGQIALENAEAQQNSQGQDADPASSGIERLMSDGKPHVFVAGDSLDVVDESGAECPLSDGDVLQLNSAPAADATDAKLVVLASKGNKECAKAANVTVPVSDLQEMQNHLRETIDQGMQEMKDKQGKNGLPAAPASAKGDPVQSEFAKNAPPPEQDGDKAINDQLSEADKSEQQVSQEAPADSAGGGAETAQTPAAPAQAAPAEIAVGQTIDQVTATLGQPISIIDLGTKKIYKYKDMKITFKGGKVADVE